MDDELKKFIEYRKKMNKKILDSKNLDIKRFFGLDSSVYRKGVLDEKTKELLGLVASTVMRCNECIVYHLIQCIRKKITDEELHEALAVALIVGGSITIPHLRYAFEMIEEIRKKEERNGSS